MEGGFRNAVVIGVFNFGLENLKHANKENLRGVPPEKKMEFNEASAFTSLLINTAYKTPFN